MRLHAPAPLLLLLALLALPRNALAAPPGYCRALGSAPHDRGGGPVLLTAAPHERVEIDGTEAMGGTLLVVGLAIGKHRVVIRPAAGPPQVHVFDLPADRRAVRIPAVGGGPRRIHGSLALVRVATIHRASDEALGRPPVPRLFARPIQATELARYHCDPRLGGQLPPVAELLASTEAACDAGDGFACQRAADQWFDAVGARARDPARATRRLDRACTLGVGDACELLARMIDIGNGTPRDPDRAAKLLEATCRGGHARSCATRAWALLPASPTLLDRAHAAPLMQRACELDLGFCDPAREQQLRLACSRGDHGACDLLLPGDTVRVAAETKEAEVRRSGANEDSVEVRTTMDK